MHFMVRRLTQARVGLTLVLSLTIAVAEAQPAELSDANALSVYRSSYAVLRKEGFLPTVSSEEDSPRIRGRERSALLDVDTIEIRGLLQMTLDARTGDIMRIWNPSAYERWHADQEKHPEIQPDWTSDNALTQARRVLRLVWKDVADNLMQIPRYPYFAKTGDRNGHWQVEWREMLNGYPYDRKGYGVYLHEQFGLMSCSWGNVSDACPTDVRIDRHDAMKRARAFIDKAYSHLTWDTMHDDISGLQEKHLYTQPDFPNGSLLIVTPDVGWDRNGAAAGKYATSKRATRLAYVVEFEPAEGRVPIGGSPSTQRVIEVFVDAGTGEIIGGFTHFAPK